MSAPATKTSNGLVTHESQVAGHGDLLTDPTNGRVYKRLSEPENAFYKQVQNGSRLKEFLPQYFGVQRANEKDYILLEDLTHGYVHPSVMDIKIGKVTYLPSFTKQKIDECIEKARTSTQSTDAHRVCGLQVYNVSTGKNTNMGKDWGKQIKSENLCDVLLRFLDNGIHIRSDVLDYFIHRLTLLEQVIAADYSQWKFVSSSILFVYDSEGLQSVRNSPSPPRADLRLIDFAHTLPPEDNAVAVEEVGYLEGLRKVLANFQKVRSHPQYSQLSGKLFQPSSSSPLYPHLQQHYVEHHKSHAHSAHHHEKHDHHDSKNGEHH